MNIKKLLKNNFYDIFAFILGTISAYILSNILDPYFFGFCFIIFSNPIIFLEDHVLRSGLFYYSFQIIGLVICSILLVKKIKTSFKIWLLGSSIAFLCFAGIILVDISLIYLKEVLVGSFIIQGFTFPAIYTFRIFRSLFLGGFFGIIEKLMGYYQRSK